MSQEAPKVIIVAPQQIHYALKEMYPHWDVQVELAHLNDMWDALDDGRVDPESEIILIIDFEFGDDPAAQDFFAASIAQLAPAALVMVLDYNDWEDAIRFKTDELLRAEGNEDVEYFFVKHNVAASMIEENLHYYYNRDAVIEEQRAEMEAITVDDRYREPVVDTSREGVVITCTSPKGGSGKSTVALLTATTLAQSSKKAVEEGLMDEPLKVIVVDMDVFDSQIGFVIGQSQPTSLNIAVANEIIGPELISKNVISVGPMGIDVLLAPKRGLTAKVTTPKFYAKVIRMLKTMYDVVILDTSVQHYDDHIKLVSLPEADVILLVTTLDRKSVMGMNRWMQVATESRENGGHGVDKNKIGVVVNQSLDGVNIGIPELRGAALSAPLLVAIPLETRDVVAAGNTNRLDTLVYHPRIGPAYQQLAEMLVAPKGIKLSPLFDDTGAAIAPSDKKPARAGLFRKTQRG